ncbi:hypothetical protein [Aquitalea aquatica]|uniref:Uncharacterized protein n=1 Tax=Aquitalea aquatica TaxID=3044273 RepID=A0A838Y428_9NEIS|nr:hypothetical protein [Aquitalea magnusonii]MBA4707287.1 hypothetical protein [Aquitalea magnusonii]
MNEEEINRYLNIFDKFKIYSLLAMFIVGFFAVTVYLLKYDIPTTYDLVNIPFYGFYSFIFLLGFIVFLFGPWCIHQTRESTICYASNLKDAWFRHATLFLIPFLSGAIIVWNNFNAYCYIVIALTAGSLTIIGILYIHNWKFSYEFFANLFSPLFLSIIASILSFLFFAIYFLFIIDIFEPSQYSKKIGGDGWYYIAACTAYSIISSFPLIISKGKNFLMAICFSAGISLISILLIAPAEFGKYALRVTRVGGGIIKEIAINKDDISKTPLRLQDYFCGLKDCSITVPRKICLWFTDGTYYYVSKINNTQGTYCQQPNTRIFPIKKELTILQ